MSYNVRDDNGLFGPLAGVEMPNGAGAPTIVAHQIMEVTGLYGIAAAGATGNYNVFIAPPVFSTAAANNNLGNQYRIVGVQYNYDTASSAGTVALEITPAGTATGSGVNPLSAATISTSVAATNTPSAAALSTNVDNLLIAPNSRINVKFGGTATGLVNFSIMIYIARVS